MDSALIIGNRRWTYDVEKTQLLCKMLMIENLTKELQCIEAYFEYEQITWREKTPFVIDNEKSKESHRGVAVYRGGPCRI